MLPFQSQTISKSILILKFISESPHTGFDLSVDLSFFFSTFMKKKEKGEE